MMRAFSPKMFPNTVDFYPRVQSVSSLGGDNPTFPSLETSLRCSVQPKTATRVEPDGVVYHETTYHISFSGSNATLNGGNGIRRDDKIVFSGLDLVVVNPPYNRGGYSASWMCICKEMGT